MSDKALSVLVVDRHSTLWEGPASYVRVPAADGSLGILPGRQPVLAVLSPGDLEIHSEDGSHILVKVAEGFVSLDEDVVTVVLEEGSVLAS